MDQLNALKVTLFEHVEQQQIERAYKWSRMSMSTDFGKTPFLYPLCNYPRPPRSYAVYYFHDQSPFYLGMPIAGIRMRLCAL